jgi:gluconolactonase
VRHRGVPSAAWNPWNPNLVIREEHMAWSFELVHGPLGTPIGGLAWDGSGMLFSDVANSQILRWDPQCESVSVFRKYTNRTSGICFGREGVLYGCQSGARRIVRFMPDGSASVTAMRLAGRVHNNPYLLAVDSLDRVWFSDRNQSAMATGPGPQRFPPLEHQSVLRLSRLSPRVSEWHIERLTFDTAAPAGVALSPDEKTLYVAESDNTPGGARELRAYPIREDGTLGPFVVWHTFGGDWRGIHRGVEGMCVEEMGNIIACAGWDRSGPGPLVYVFSPAGAVMETHRVPADEPLSCAFADDGLGSLYVSTAAGHLFRIPSVGRDGRRRG